MQNIPFLVLRIIVWAKYGVFNFGFMVENVTAIAICFAEIKFNVKTNSEDIYDGFELEQKCVQISHLRHSKPMVYTR